MALHEAAKGDAAIRVGNIDGVRIAGVLLQASARAERQGLIDRAGLTGQGRTAWGWAGQGGRRWVGA